MDLCGGEAVQQDHAAGQDRAQDQAFAHGLPLPPVLGSHDLTESNLKKKTVIKIIIIVSIFCHTKTVMFSAI